MVEKKLIESGRTMRDGTVEGEIIHYWQSEDYVPSDCRFKDVGELQEYAKKHPVILVVDLMVGSGTYTLLSKYCKGFIMNDFLGSDSHEPNPNIITATKKKPIAVVNSALGLFREELENVKSDDFKPEMFDEWNQRYEKSDPHRFRSVERREDGMHYILYKDDWDIKYDPSKVLLPEGTKVRLECKDGKVTVYKLD